MKIMWITNVELPAVTKYRGEDTVVGGWMDFSSQLLAERTDIELQIFSLTNAAYEGLLIGNIAYHSFTIENVDKVINNALNEIQPDVLHIWGSEYVHSLKCILAAAKLHYLPRTIVSIQGLVSVYHEHYLLGIPYEVIHHRSIYERLRKNSLLDQKRKMWENGENEKQTYSKAINCIGRTEWDYACVKEINPQIRYYCCNEILREGFYKNSWKYENCEKYKIAFSQAHYSIKGLHIILQAMPIIKKFYPQVKLSIVGSSIFDEKYTFVKRNTYREYLKRLIADNDLYDNVEWIGQCDEKKMIAHYLNANVFVSASTIENSSNSIAEAMILGVPVVASDVGGIKSFMLHEKEGLLYQADAYYMLAYCIIRIFQDRNYAKMLGENAQRRARQTHDYVKNTDELIKIYKNIAEKNDK